MQIARRFTTEGRDPYETVAFRSAAARSATPTARSCSRPRGSRCRPSGARSPATSWPRNTCARPACRRVSSRSRRTGCRTGCGAARADAAALAALPKAERSGGETSAKQCFDRLAGTWTYWGWKGGYFDSRSRRPRLLRRDPASCWRARWARRTRRNGSTPASTGPTASTGRRRAITTSITDRQGARLRQRLRAPAAARLLHPVGRRRPRQRGRHHGSLGARGAAVQIRLGHRLQFLEAARRRREAVGRRPLVRADELSEDRRPRRRRDQIGRHDAARRQDGHRRRRPSRYRGSTSTGRSSRSRRSPRWSPARNWRRST